MRIMTRSHAIFTVLLSTMLLASPGVAGEPRSVPLAPLSSESGDATRTLAEFSGKYVIVDFMGAMPDPERERLVKERRDGLATIAGTQLVIVVSGDGLSGTPWWKPDTTGRSTAVADAERALAREFNLDEGPSATIVLDKSGRELFRQVASSASPTLPTVDLIKRIDQATGAIARAQYNLPKGEPLAIEGYDPVAYFQQAKAVRGRRELLARYEGVTYSFASAADRDVFITTPEKYLPTYGGWCASAMGAKGTKVEIDPTNFKIKDGRLHLFYKGLFADALKDWNQHEREWEPAADANWLNISGESPRTTAK